jgi:hypothetical protein
MFLTEAMRALIDFPHLVLAPGIRQLDARANVRAGRNPGDHPKGITMLAGESNDRAVKVAFGSAMPGKSWDKLACKEKDH